MATKKIQIIPPGYTDVCYPQTTASVVIEETDKRFMTDAEKSKLASIKEISTARFVVGTSVVGWTSADCDYLCDGTSDDVEINNAITALPATGGEVVILDGTYNITAKINVTKDNVSIRGNGNATILKRMFNSSLPDGVITLTDRSGCKIANLQIDGNKISYTNSNNYGIYLRSSDNNTFTGNTCNDNDRGIFLSSSSSSTVTGNTCNNNNYGIYLSASSNNTVTGNTCNNNSNGIYLYASSSDTITGNTCYQNNSGIYLNAASSNTVTGNTCIRGTGLPTDYSLSQYTIMLNGTGNNYNLISNNNCMGKAVTGGGGTGNTLVNNKWDASSDSQALAEDVVAHKAENVSLGNPHGIDAKANKVQEAWVAPTLISGWVNMGAGFESAGYMKDEFGFVCLKGVVRDGALISPIFTMPVGYRPSQQVEFSAVSTGTGRIAVDAGGNVVPFGGENSKYCLDGIRFRL